MTRSKGVQQKFPSTRQWLAGLRDQARSIFQRGSQHEISLEEHARWFTKFDEEVIKPVLLDTMPLDGFSDHPQTPTRDLK